MDAGLIPTGELAAVENTPMDFRKPHAIGERIGDVAGGYDHNYVLDKDREGTLTLAARVEEPKSGRVMSVSTTEPGMQLYTGNFLDGIAGKAGKSYPQYGGLCLETQHFPDAVNQPSFPSVILQPGERYSQVTVYAFWTK